MPGIRRGLTLNPRPWLYLRLSSEFDVDPAWRERQPNPLICRNPIDHHTILITESRYRPTPGDRRARSDRYVIAAEIGNIAQIVYASAASDPRRAYIHH